MGGCGDSDDLLFLEFLRACIPHLGWLSAELRCTPWVLIKRVTLFVDRVFDTARSFACLRRHSTSLRQFTAWGARTGEVFYMLPPSPPRARAR